jgi:HAE1 family hydrophobic/amphiphilic exporter-1
VVDGTAVRIYISTEDPPATQAALAALAIPTPTGLVRLDSLATVAVTDGPATITTIKGARSATVTVSPKSSDLGTASAQVQKAVDAITLPAGATANLGGATSDQQAAFSQLGIALLIAILVVYIIMVATFGSLLQPLLLLVSVPFAATGAIALQVATGIPLGVPSIIGVLMLIGIVVTNAIVLIDLVNQYRAKGMDVRNALIEGAKRRLRPILMTALATIFALVPMAMGLTGSGGFISQPLAIVVIGGLLSSTVLTLIVLPVLYFLVEGKREKNKIKRDAKRASKRAAARAAAGLPAEVLPAEGDVVLADVVAASTTVAAGAPAGARASVADGTADEPIRRRSTATNHSSSRSRSSQKSASQPEAEPAAAAPLVIPALAEIVPPVAATPAGDLIESDPVEPTAIGTQPLDLSAIPRVANKVADKEPRNRRSSRAQQSAAGAASDVDAGSPDVGSKDAQSADDKTSEGDNSQSQ